MIEYLKNIIPRIKQYSKELDKSENFVGKNWVFIDEDQNRHEYIFLRDKRLIMTLNSTTKQGSWEFLPTGELLINRNTSEYIKLSNLFIQDALMVLKYSATNDTPFILINQNLIPDLNVVAYLEKYAQQKELSETPPQEQKFKILETGEIYGQEFYEGQFIKINNLILNGTYRAVSDESAYERYIVIHDNRISRVYFKINYSYNNIKFTIEQKDFSNPLVGDTILDGTSLRIPTNQIIKIKNNSYQVFSIRVDNSYKLTLALDSQMAFLLKLVIVIFILVIIFVLV